MVDISVIMPIYKVEKLLDRAIQSVLNQTHSNLELILVNDGSPDNSGDICDYYTGIDYRVKVIHQKNSGVGFARNVGLSLAQGKYIYFVDPDDYIEPDLIKDNFEIAIQNSANVVIFGFFNEKLKKNGEIIKEEILPRTKDLITKEDFRLNFRDFYDSTADVLWNKLYNKEYLFRNMNKFTNQKVGEDALFNLSLYREIDKVHFNDKSYYHYVSREGSAVNKYNTQRFEDEFNVACQFENLMKYWNLETKNVDLIKRRYWSAIFSELRNLSLDNSYLKREEKKEKIKKIMEIDKIKSIISSLDTNNQINPFSKVLIASLNAKKYNRVLNIFMIRIIIENNFPIIFLSIWKRINKTLFHK